MQTELQVGQDTSYLRFYCDIETKKLHVQLRCWHTATQREISRGEVEAIVDFLNHIKKHLVE